MSEVDDMIYIAENVLIEQHEKTLNAVYHERNQVVLLAARMAQKLGYKVGIGYDDDPELDQAMWAVVFIDLPGCGQVSWHLPQYMIDALELDPIPDYDGEWDGHDSDEKYLRVDLYVNPLSFG
jgi:hypothetical protein